MREIGPRWTGLSDEMCIRDSCMAGAESDEESEDQQGADGASHEHESCGSGPAA